MSDEEFTIKKMDPEVKAQWIAALRSGEYQQGYGIMCEIRETGKNHCCLGVLSELYPDIIKVEEGSRIAFQAQGNHFESGIYLPVDAVVEWADVDPEYRIMHRDEMTRLYNLNDRGFSFSEIADLIEEQM